jgi:hypothetical protein
MTASRNFRAGSAFRVLLPSFTVEIRFLEAQRLRLAVTDGEGAGFSDEVDYALETTDAGVTLLSWRERIGSCVVHVIDPDLSGTHVFVASADGRFLRLKGSIVWLGEAS